MKGVTLMEVILISLIMCCICFLAFVKLIKPQEHSYKKDIEQLQLRVASIESMKIIEEDKLKERLAYLENKTVQLNNDLLNQISVFEEREESLSEEFDDAHEHVARLQRSVSANHEHIKKLEQKIHHVDKSVEKRVKPLLVEIYKDPNLRTYTIEKVIRTKDGYKRKSMSRTVRKDEKKNIKKLNLPGATQARDSLVQNQL